MGDVLFPNLSVDKQGRVTVPQFYRVFSGDVIMFEDSDYEGSIIMHFLGEETEVRGLPVDLFFEYRVKLDEKGRVFVPKALQRQVGMEGDSEAQWQYLDNNEILLTPANTKRPSPHVLKKHL